MLSCFFNYHAFFVKSQDFVKFPEIQSTGFPVNQKLMLLSFIAVVQISLSLVIVRANFCMHSKSTLELHYPYVNARTRVFNFAQRYHSFGFRSRLRSDKHTGMSLMTVERSSSHISFVHRRAHKKVRIVFVYLWAKNRGSSVSLLLILSSMNHNYCNRIFVMISKLVSYFCLLSRQWSILNIIESNIA